MIGFPNPAAVGRMPTVILGLAMGLVCVGCTALDPEGTICDEADPNCIPEDDGLGGSGGDSGGTAGAAGSGPPPPSAWSCLNAPYVSDIPRPMNVSFAMVVVDFNNPSAAMAIEGLEGKVCQIQDLTCTQPLPIPVVTQIPGRPPPLIALGAPLPFAYDGYLRFTAPNYLQAEYFFVGELGLNLDAWDGTTPPTIVGEPITLPLVSRIDEFFDVVTGSRTNRDPNAGIVALRTFDCLGRRAAGVSLEILSETPGTEFPWVFANRLPVARTETDRDGVAGFGNVSTARGAVIDIQGIAPNRTPYGRVAVIVRPNQLTFADVRPAGAYARTPMAQ